MNEAIKKPLHKAKGIYLVNCILSHIDKNVNSNAKYCNNMTYVQLCDCSQIPTVYNKWEFVNKGNCKTLQCFTGQGFIDFQGGKKNYD